MRLAELLTQRVRLRHLVVAAAIAEQGSVREASAVLHLTQPATSRSLRELEEALGVAMFERGPKGMSLTAAGTSLLPHMQVIVSEVGSLHRHAGELRDGRSGEVRVGTLLAAAADVLPLAIGEVSRRFPQLSIAVTEGTPDILHTELMLGGLDLIVGRVTPIATMPGVAVEPLFDDHVSVLCAAAHSASTQCGSLGDLVDQRWILPPRDTSLRQQVEAAFIRECGRVPAQVIECVAPVPLKRLLLDGEHLAVVPSGVFVDEIERNSLVALPVEIPGTTVPVGIITRAGSELPSGARVLVGAIRDSAIAVHEPVPGSPYQTP